MEKTKKKKEKAVTEESLVKEEVKEDQIQAEELSTEETPVVEETKVEEKRKLFTKEEKNNGDGQINEVLMTLVRVLLGIFLWFPSFCVLLLSLVALGIAISLVIMGIEFLGILFIVSGCLVIALAFILPLTRFVWGRKVL